MSFIIYALPRSRTFWLSRFLSYRDWYCGHDEIRHARTLEDVKSWFKQPNTGTIETLGAPWWRLVEKYAPGIKTVVIRRSVADVVASLAHFGFDPAQMTPLMTRYDRKLDQIEKRVPGVLSIQFKDLKSEATCAKVFQHCLPYHHDPKWWAMMDQLNLQVDMAAIVRYCQAYQPQLDLLAKTVRHVAIGEMNRRSYEIDGVTIQQESFEDVYRDGEHLFRDHCVTVGEPPDSWLGKNIPAMRQMAETGRLIFTTARSNGRLFGYLMAVMAPSLESETVISGLHTLFYASKDIPGLGMKLQRASVEALRQRGVGEVFLRAGTRGSGPRLGTIARRLGAEEFGQLYKLELDGAA